MIHSCGGSQLQSKCLSRVRNGSSRQPMDLGSSKLRVEFWDDIVGLNSLCGPNWCLEGDFNMIRLISEKNTCKRITKSMSNFDSLISELEL